MENTISTSKDVQATASVEQPMTSVERSLEDAALLLRLRQMGDHGLRRAMQLLADNE